MCAAVPQVHLVKKKKISEIFSLSPKPNVELVKIGTSEQRITKKNVNERNEKEKKSFQVYITVPSCEETSTKFYFVLQWLYLFDKQLEEVGESQNEYG